MLEQNQQQSGQSNVTIVFPAFNNPDQLNRVLTFLNAMENPHSVVVLDGSYEENKPLNRKVCQTHHVQYQAYPFDMHMGLRLYKGLSQWVKTPYVFICADDEFVLPQTLNRGAEFFDTHPEYSAVNGLIRCLVYPTRGSSRFFSLKKHLRSPHIQEENSFLARYIKSNAYHELGCFPLFYSLRRTEQAVEAFSYFQKLPNSFKLSSMELLTNAVTLLQGKTTTLPTLMLIKNYSNRPSSESNRHDDNFYVTDNDVLLTRDLIREKIRKEHPDLSPDVFEFMLEQCFPVPTPKVDNYEERFEQKTKLMHQLEYKKNWLFYLLNAWAPTLSEKIDSVVSKRVISAMRMAFKSPMKFSAKATS